MSVAELNHISIKRISSLHALLIELKKLDNQLAESNLSCLVTFNRAYWIVTSSIQEAINEGYFENPKFIKSFTLNFSHYYFNAINDALDGNELPVAWSELIASNSLKRLPNFIYLLMGANAHINHDLTLVMLKMLDNDDTENLLQDILKVDKLLVKSSRGILDTFTETKHLPRFIKNRLRYIYLPVVIHVILYWRIKAWKDYLVIKKNGMPPNRPQTRGKTINIKLLKLGGVLS